MIDIVGQLNHVHREVGTGRIGQDEARSVLLRREYDAPVEDVWDACTDPERVGRWFLPVTGDFRLGGRYQLEGNAGGEILVCERPTLLRVTWAFGELPPSEVELRCTPAGDERTVVELEHIGVTEPTMWAQFGPGAVGVGWDLVVLGLYTHLVDPSSRKPEAPEQTPEFREYITGSAAAWGTAHEKSGATAEEAAEAVRNTTAFYTVGPQA